MISFERSAAVPTSFGHRCGFNHTLMSLSKFCCPVQCGIPLLASSIVLCSVGSHFQPVLLSCVVWDPTLNQFYCPLQCGTTLSASSTVPCSVGSHSQQVLLPCAGWDLTLVVIKYKKVLLSCVLCLQSLPLSESCCVLATNLSLATAQSTATGRPTVRNTNSINCSTVMLMFKLQ